MNGYVAICLAGALALTTGCINQDEDGHTDAELRQMQKAPALTWLRSNGNPSALATNRFGDTSAAIVFVEQLLHAGAVNIYISDPYDEPERIAREGGPYADSLIVELPSATDQRAEIFRILAAEAESGGFVPPKDAGQNMELLWWD